MSANLAAQLAHLPDYLGSHLLLTITGLAIGIAISLPTALAATRIRALKLAVLTIASVMQTVPGLALLALMVPLLGKIGFVPAAIALILYSMLPILRNTVTGIEHVDTSLIEAARGMGMTDAQLLFKVQLPLAAPMVIAGIRTATVWVVGTATLSTPVGATSLGNYIFSGLQTQNHTAVIIGCVAAALLAIILDSLIRLLEFASEKRSRGLAVLSIGLLLAVFATGLLPKFSSADDTRPRVIVGAKTFTEQYILSRVISERLNEAGFQAAPRESMGSIILFDALTQGLVDCYVDYSGTIWVNSMGCTKIPSRQEVLDSMTQWLWEKHQVKCLGSLGFENRYALAMRGDHADSLGIRTITDLAPYSSSLTIGGDYEFFSRPEWQALQSTYKLDFSARHRRSLDGTLMYSAVATGQVDVISAYSTDGRIADLHLAVLDDPEQALPPYDAVLLLSPHASQNSKLIASLREMIGEISDEEMRTANKIVDVDNLPIDSAVSYIQSILH